MHIHFVEHESFEAPGAYTHWARLRGYTTTYSRVHSGDPLPTRPDELARIDLLVVLGGPQSPATRLAECPHFDAAAERQLITLCVAAGKAVVGICLGAQLLGEALGAPYAHSPEREIGVFPITLSEAGLHHPKLAHLGTRFPVGHWHADMPGLTPNARVLASSAGCPRQIVEYTDLAYGFQCHMEFTQEVVEALIQASGPELTALHDHAFVQQPDTLRAHDYGPMNQKLFGFLDALVADYLTRAPR